MTKDNSKGKGKGKHSDGTNAPYDVNNARRSVRQVQLLSLNQAEPMTDIQSHTISFPTDIPTSQLQLSGANQSAANAEASQNISHDSNVNDSQVVQPSNVNVPLVENVDNIVSVNQIHQTTNLVDTYQVELPTTSNNSNLVSLSNHDLPSTSTSQGINNNSEHIVHISDKGQQNGPTMDQFMMLQNTMLEMKRMMGTFSSNSNSVQNLPVNSQANASVDSVTLQTGANVSQYPDSNMSNQVHVSQLSQNMTQVQNAPNMSQTVNQQNVSNVSHMNPNINNVSQSTGVNQFQNSHGINNIQTANSINGTSMVGQPIGWLNNGITSNSGPIDPTNILSNDTTQSNISMQMQGAVGQHVQSLIGQLDSTGKESSYEDLGRQIDIRVSDKVRNQIWSNQYVDLSILIDPKSEVPDSLKWDGDSLCLAPHKSIRKLNGLGQWCDAFHIYICVYTRKYPNMIANLLTYMHNIKMLCNKGGDYMYYDEEYRTMRQRNPSNNWEINWDLWLECRDIRGNTNRSQNKRQSNNHTFRGQSASGAKASHPAGFCFKFHNNGRCGNGANCSYKHTCYMSNCGERHAVFNCPKRGAKGNNKANNPTGSNGSNHPNKAT